MDPAQCRYPVRVKTAPASALTPMTNVSQPPAGARHRQRRGLTLVEIMVSMWMLATVMLGFIATYMQSRRSTEANVLAAAATALTYGIIEQVKQLDYTTLLPNYEVDPDAPTVDDNGDPFNPPYLRIRLNQDVVRWVRVVHNTDSATVAAPATTPPDSAVAADVGAIDNFIGSIPLSTITGTASQTINLNLWIWIDEIADQGTWASEATQPDPDCAEVKKITLVYTYSYQDGGSTRTVRNREVFLRTRYDQ